MRRFLFLLLLPAFVQACAQKNAQNPYGLKIINNFRDYQAAVKENPDNQLVEINKAIPSVRLDIRYATRNNFMKRVMYAQARAFARKPVVVQLRKVQADLQKKGLGLKIFDAYRPYAVTLDFYRQAVQKDFVANPNKGSKHNRGCAIDLTLISLKTGKELPMPTPFDSFSPEAAARYANLDVQVKKNRDLLISTMHRHGFKVMYNEWWHFDFQGWQNYSLMDIPFQKL
ncbi:D-alanyl-D-alanine dipeptidase [Pedobacter yulinensis]|uniref:D-alanyl-D-alanine dipeptidase n=1 Tax=Pedobacter yulinensis TaxID=2126353 RepID=A0A2T3HRJ4_9SPHI|nr:M15 family metallopeptidase [Pedobacter yulinensis]PST85090.1 D-alanyl-D-alanine dipeptidase [Pedobacter yulinensis]